MVRLYHNSRWLTSYRRMGAVGRQAYWLGDRPSGLEFAVMYGWVNVCRDLIVQQTTFITLDGDGETAL
jgi:hypothetical protein